MSKFIHFIVGILAFVLVFILTVYIGDFFSSGSNELGYIIVAVALLCGVIVGCTSLIVETIKECSK